MEDNSKIDKEEWTKALFEMSKYWLDEMAKKKKAKKVAKKAKKGKKK